MLLVRSFSRDRVSSYAVTRHPDTRFSMKAAATSAFDFPMSDSLEYSRAMLVLVPAKCYRKRNCRLRLVKSMVSMSMTSIFRKPESACKL